MSKLFDNWRSELYATGNFDHDELNELESHLKDEMEHVESTILNEEEKLLVAQHRLGSAGILNEAYRKKGWLSLTHLSWAMQILMAYFLLREIVVMLSYVGADTILWMGVENTATKFGVPIGLEALGLVLLILFLRYIIKLNYTARSYAKPNLIMAGVCGSILLIRTIYIYAVGGPTLHYESILVAQLFSYIPVTLAFAAMAFLSLKSWNEAKRLPPSKTLQTQTE